MLFLLTLIISLIVASLVGHLGHWALHQRWTWVLHRAHMDHHLTQYPPGKLTSDRYRFPKWYNNGLLLFTPPLLVLMGSAALIVWSLHWPWWMLAVLGTCVATLGFLNDWVHDSFHVRRHPLMHLRTYQKLRRLHFIHHSNMDKNFGIVSFVWDRVFGTLVTEK